MHTSAVNEDAVERAALSWLAGLGWETVHGPDISPPDAKTAGTERDTYREVVLKHRLRDAIQRLNPHIPPGARDEAARMVLNPPPRQNSCRLHRPTQGAAMKDGLGSIRTGIQGQGGSEVAATGERITGRGVA
jgi:hypothetical protein